MTEEDSYIAIHDNSPVSIEAAWKFINKAEYGGNAFLVGSIRNQNQGKEVASVEYDVYDALFVKTLKELYVSLLNKHQCLLKMYVAHSKGLVHVGEASIVIAFSSPKLKEAQLACKETFEFIKYKSPVWKKEFYVKEGETGWVQGHALCQSL
ncbi:hypothetical protein A8135_00275 [Legionella jamestowniensis]|nr:hypothetical protein A8135_00275 [Legionella jamestowniensis]